MNKLYDNLFNKNILRMADEAETEAERAAKQADLYDKKAGGEFGNQSDFSIQLQKLIDFLVNLFSSRSYAKIQNTTTLTNFFRNTKQKTPEFLKDFEKLYTDFLTEYNKLPNDDSIKLIVDSQKFDVAGNKSSFIEILQKIQNKEITPDKLTESQSKDFVSQLQTYQTIVNKRLAEIQENQGLKSQAVDLQSDLEKRERELIDVRKELKSQQDKLMEDFARSRVNQSQLNEMRDALSNAKKEGQVSVEQEKKIVELQQQIEEVNSQLEETNSQNQLVLEENQKLQNEMQALENQKKEAEDKVANNQFEKVAKEREIKQLSEQIAFANNRFKILREDIQKSANQELRNRGSLEDEMEKLREQVENLTDINQEQANLLQREASQREKLIQKLDSTRNQISLLENKISHLDKNSKDYQDEVKKLNDEKLDLQSKVNTLIERNRANFQSKKSYEVQVTEFKRKLTDSKKKAEEMTQLVKSKAIKTDEDQKESIRQIANLDHGMNLLMEQYEELHGQNETKEQAIQKAQDLITKLQEEKKQIEAKVKTQGKNIRKSDNKDTALEQQIENLQQRVKELTAQNEAEKKSGKQNSEQQNQEIETRNKELEKMKDEMDLLRGQIKELNEIVEREKTENSTLKTALMNHVKKYQSLKSTHEKNVQEFQKLSDSYSELDDKNDELEEQIEELKQKNNKAIKELKQKNNKAFNAKEDERVARLAETLKKEELQRQLSALEKENENNIAEMEKINDTKNEWIAKVSQTNKELTEKLDVLSKELLESIEKNKALLQSNNAGDQTSEIDSTDNEFLKGLYETVLSLEMQIEEIFHEIKLEKEEENTSDKKENKKASSIKKSKPTTVPRSDLYDRWLKSNPEKATELKKRQEELRSKRIKIAERIAQNKAKVNREKNYDEPITKFPNDPIRETDEYKRGLEILQVTNETVKGILDEYLPYPELISTIKDTKGLPSMEELEMRIKIRGIEDEIHRVYKKFEMTPREFRIISLQDKIGSMKENRPTLGEQGGQRKHDLKIKGLETELKALKEGEDIKVTLSREEKTFLQTQRNEAKRELESLNSEKVFEQKKLSYIKKTSSTEKEKDTSSERDPYGKDVSAGSTKGPRQKANETSLDNPLMPSQNLQTDPTRRNSVSEGSNPHTPQQSLT